jgi:hypothetical protein
MTRRVLVIEDSQDIAGMTKAEKRAKDAPLKKEKIAEGHVVKGTKMKYHRAGKDKIY